MDRKSKINDIVILYYLMNNIKIKPLKNLKNEYVFRRYDIESNDENLAVCCACLKRLKIRDETDLLELFETYKDEINNTLSLKNINKFQLLKQGYFKYVVKYKSNYEIFKSTFNLSNYNENYREYIYYKTMIKGKLNDKNLVKNLNRDVIIFNIVDVIKLYKHTYKKYGCEYKYYVYNDKIIEFTSNLSILYPALLNYSFRNKYITFDQNKILGIYLSNLHKIILFQSDKLNGNYKIWKQPNADIIRLYILNTNKYVYSKKYKNITHLYGYLDYHGKFNNNY